VDMRSTQGTPTLPVPQGFHAGECFKSGDDDSYGFDLKGVISIYIHV